MQRRVHNVIAIVWAVGVLWGCAHAPVRHHSSVFNDPETEKRVRSLREQLSIDADDVEGRIELGKLFLSEQMVENAITELEKAVDSDGENVKALLLMALACRKLPTPDLIRAVSYLEKASQIEPDNADVHLNLAQVCTKLKDEKKAIYEFEQAIALSNDLATLVSAHLGLMSIYEKQGKIEKANEEYEAAYEISPEVKEMIKQAEIMRITPVPIYRGGELTSDNGLHPSLEQRILRAQEEIRKISVEQNE